MKPDARKCINEVVILLSQNSQYETCKLNVKLSQSEGKQNFKGIQVFFAS